MRETATAKARRIDEATGLPKRLVATSWFVLTGLRSEDTGGYVQSHRIDHDECYTNARGSLMVVGLCGSERTYGGSRRDTKPNGHPCERCNHLHRIKHQRNIRVTGAEGVA